jgi:thioredoxin-like negative regulator of GroEL
MKEFAEGQNAFNSPIPDDVVRHYDNARLAFGMAVALDPTYAEARYNLAVALRETQHPRAALDQLWRAHADDGGDAAKLCQDIKKLEKYLQAQGFQPVVTAPSQVTP